MELELFGDVNWLAVAIAVIIYYVLGSIWFLPQTFGTYWSRAIGWEQPGEFRPSPSMLAGPLVACILIAATVGVLVEAAGSDGLGEGLVLGIVLGVGVVGGVLLAAAAVEPKMPRPFNWAIVVGSYHLVGLVVVSALISAW